MSDFKQPAVTADTIINREDKYILLIKRKNYPFQGKWALPGGFIDYGKETVEDCAVREAEEETSLRVKIKSLLGIWSTPGRDPRGHTVTAVYVTDTLTIEQASTAQAADDAQDIRWVAMNKKSIDEIDFAFDHKDIIVTYFNKCQT